MSLDASYNLKRSYVEVVTDQLRRWVGKDATRRRAAKVLDEWHLRDGLTEELRKAVLDHFDADRDPQPFVDYLPEDIATIAAEVPAELAPLPRKDSRSYEWGELD